MCSKSGTNGEHQTVNAQFKTTEEVLEALKKSLLMFSRAVCMLRKLKVILVTNES